MRLRVVHTTTYRYRHAVKLLRHRLVVRPREGHDLRVTAMTLTLQPSCRVVWTRDVFGNSIALVDWLEPSDLLQIVNDVTVERTAPFPTEEIHDPWRTPFPPQYDPLEAGITAAYQQPVFPEAAAPLMEWVHAGLTVNPDDAEGTMLRVCELVHQRIAYRHRSEKGVQAPDTTLSLATGSCRDLATLMMEAARGLGVAARFASGYLHGTASLAGHASTHAWTEVYLPTLGWRAFDPTIGAATSLRHVATGVSSHPRGVMPVSGTFVGRGTDCLSMTAVVKTEELPDAVG